MKRLSLPTLPKLINKTAVTVTAVVLILAALILFGAVQSVRADREAAQASAAVAQQAKNKEKTMADRIATLEAENKQLAGQAQAKQLACLEIKRLDSVRAITASVSVPAYCL